MSELRLVEYTAEQTWHGNPHSEWQVINRGIDVAVLSEQEILDAATRITRKRAEQH